MKAFRSLRILISISRTKIPRKSHQAQNFLRRFYSAQPNVDEPTSVNEDGPISDSVFDSSQFSIEDSHGDSVKKQKQATWDKDYRERVNKLFFENEIEKGKLKIQEEESSEDEDEDSIDRSRILAKTLLEAALESADEELGEGEVREEDQKSLNVGIIGPPNAGKSSLTNFMVGTKVAAASRKTNTTTHEVLGVLTKGDTQVCFFDTPGLMLKKSGYGYKDIKSRVQNAWTSVDLFDVLIVMFDVHRHLMSPDSRVVRLIKYMGEEENPKQKRILCMNKVDLVEKKKDLLKVAEEFQNLPAYERYFMISGLKGSGVKDLTQYLMDQAVKKPWEEDAFTMSEEVMKNISLEVVRERLLDHVHQEVPYGVEHRLVDWKELRDGSLRIEQHLITPKPSQRKILVGKGGCKIGRIGIEANEELRRIMNRKVHLILQVGTKVAAASRKTNTTTHEVLGVLTKGDTQVCFFDTPGLMLKKSGYGYKDIKSRVQNAWTSVDLFDVLIVMFDVHRHLMSPDSRVVRLIKYMGEEENPKQKRILCMNKVDLVEKKKDLLKVAEEFQNLPAYERYFMISGLKGSGVKDLTQYLMDQAVKKPWEEDAFTMSEEVMKNISLEVVRERLLDHVHQEVPYGVEHRLVDWKELRDGSLRIEQHLITPKPSQRKILVGKGGCKIGRIGIEANEELRRIMNRKVHLILQVKLK